VAEAAEFQGKVAVVTGGSTGIGRATVERLARGGASVVFCSNDAASVDAASRELAAAGDVIGRLADVSQSEQMAALMRRVVDERGGIDLLACCAGIQRYGTVEDTEEPVWDEVLAVNLKGCYLASRFAIPAMRRRGGGAIVLVSSVQSLACQTQVAAYAASKGAINALARSIALDFASERIRVNAVCPGAVDTPMLRASAARFGGGRAVAEVVRDWAASHPLGKGYGRACSAAEIAEVIAFLLSERASFMTGSEVKVEGGLLARLGVVLPE
jgi:NAD(P)-dependent dehydrogenase (short-subunit alcohol dehydrogenase family)